MGKVVFEKPFRPRFSFAGPMGERVKANVDNWLLRAPVANPGMIEMFRLRDRKPKPKLVDWAGEFVGKYLISAIQARRMTDGDSLDALIRRVIADLIGCQADDGYLGPFTREERLLGHWDLWGHYHWMLALMMWHGDTGDTEALNCGSHALFVIHYSMVSKSKPICDLVNAGILRVHRPFQCCLST